MARLSILHQVLISDDEPAVEATRIHVERYADGVFAEVRFWDREDCRAIVQRTAGEAALQAFDQLRPYAYKADLARYCILLSFGGWYCDIKVEGFVPPELPAQTDLVVFRDIQRYSGTSWAVSNALIYSRQGNPVFEMALRDVVRNVQQRFYGATPLHPTGPVLFGKCVAVHGNYQELVVGDLLELTPPLDRKNAAFVMPNGDLIAWNKRAPGGVLDIAGTNDYNTFWASRSVYVD